MFWTSLYWRLLYWTGKSILQDTFSGTFSYNWYNFDSSNINIYNIPDIDNLWEITNNKYKTARENWMWYVTQTINLRTITIEWSLKADSATELEQIMWGIKQKLYEPNKKLLIKRASGELWETQASCTVLDFDRQQYTVDWVQFRIVFEVIDPFFYGQSLQEIPFLWQSNSFTSTVENLIGERKSLPVVRVQFGSGLSDVTTVTVTIWGITTSATWTFTDSDILTIDCKGKDVLLNSVGEQAFTGGFGVLEIGSNPIEVAIDGIRTADIYFTRYPTYG